MNGQYSYYNHRASPNESFSMLPPSPVLADGFTISKNICNEIYNYNYNNYLATIIPTLLYQT